MAKFRYYITDLNEGHVVGTNSEELASNCALSEDYFVVDAEQGEWLQSDEFRSPVEDIEGD